MPNSSRVRLAMSANGLADPHAVVTHLTSRCLLLSASHHHDAGPSATGDQQAQCPITRL